MLVLFGKKISMKRNSKLPASFTMRSNRNIKAILIEIQKLVPPGEVLTSVITKLISC